MEATKVRIQTAPGAPPTLRGCFPMIWRTEGIMGFYKGELLYIQGRKETREEAKINKGELHIAAVMWTVDSDESYAQKRNSKGVILLRKDTIT